MRDISIIDPITHSQALMAAVKADSAANVCLLVMKGAQDITPALQVAIREQRTNAAAVLTLIRAAQTDDCHLAVSLFQDGFQGGRGGATASLGEIPMVVPIEMACQYGHRAVREELLFRTDVWREQGTVWWDGLHLCALEPQWLPRLDWTTHLTLAWNCLSELPTEMVSLVKVGREDELAHWGDIQGDKEMVLHWLGM